MYINLNVVIGILILLLYVGSLIAVGFFIRHTVKKYETEMKTISSNIQNQITARPVLRLSFSECNDIINTVIDDIWKNKYFITYRLREMRTIPSMDNEIASFVKDVMGSLSLDIIKEAEKYYSQEYIIQKITRQAQMLFIEYINTYKPNTK